MKDYKIFFNVIYLKKYLKEFSSVSERIEYLKYLKNEFIDLYDHYTDEEIRLFLEEHKLEDKIKKDYIYVEYDYELSRVENSCYRTFLEKIGCMIPFVQKEIKNLMSELNEPVIVKQIPNIIESDISDNKKLVLKFNNNALKLRWQKDNVLLPYLFEVLLEEGFISQSDYEDRHKFIEQSFLKKNGKPFTAKETDQSELNYRTNSKNNKKPRNAFKVDRVVTKLKSKEKKPK